METSESEELIALLRDDPEKGLPAVIERNMGLFHHIVGRVSQGYGDREELFQEVVLKFMEVGAQRLLNWDSAKSAFSTYLYLVVWSLSRDCRRKLDREDSRQRSSFPDDGDDGTSDPMDKLPGQDEGPRNSAALLEASGQLEDCFEKLVSDNAARKPDWFLVGLRAEGASAKEVGGLLGLSEDTVHQRYKRLRQRLRECLAEHGFGSLADVVSDRSRG